MDLNPFTKVKDELVAKNRKFETHVATFELNGVEKDLHYVHFPHGGAMMVAVRDDGKVLLQRQYRPIVGHVSIEFPAGGIEPGEEPLTAAKRELAEESNVAAHTWEAFGHFEADPGSTSAVGWVFLAHDVYEQVTPNQEFEIIESFWETPESIDAMIKDGTIVNGWSMCSWLLTRERVRELVDQIKQGG